MASNAAAIVVGRERKGHPYLKHVILAGLLQRSNWKVFREYIWNWSKSNYNRAQYCFHPAYVFRRGNMPTVKLSKARYKDIIFVPRPKHKDLHTPDVQSMPVELVEILVSLFVKDSTQINVLDPFAGSAVVACAAENLGCRSVSVELQRARFEELSLAIWPKLTKL
jgi:DNA modification methylase